MELSLNNIAKVIYKRLSFILLLTIVGFMSMYVVNRYFIQPVYTASVQLYVNSYRTTAQENLNELNYAQKIVYTYINFLKTQEFYRQVLESAKLPYTKEQLGNMTQIDTVNSTEIFEIKVTSQRAEDSYKLVKAMQEIAPKLIGEIKDNTRISVVDPVEYPETPSGPRILFQTLVGGVVGFLLGILIALLQKMLDTKLKSEEELTDRYSYPIMGMVPSFVSVSKHKKDSLVNFQFKKRQKLTMEQNHTINHDTNFIIVESYKSLRTNLRYILRGEGCKTALINSPTPGDGKSTTCVNIAITIAQTDARVLIIDCDLRKGRLHQSFKIGNTYGISDVISGLKSVEEVIKETGIKNLHIITLGTVPPNPTELLSSVQMEELIEEMKYYYDYILLDSPPVNVVSDALSLAKLVDGVLLVVKENYTTLPNIDTAISKYKLVDGKILGFVLNDISLSPGMKSKSNYYYDNSDD